MDAIWYGIANIMEWIFALVKPVGMVIDYLFIIVITVGVIFWLWYDQQESKGGPNFMGYKEEK